MDITFTDSQRNPVGTKGQATLEELARGAHGGIAVDIQDVSITISGDNLTVVSNPLDAYSISNIDDSTSTKYYGYLNKDGGWYIMKESSSAYTYVKGISGYTTAWTGRASQTYANFDTVF